MKIDDWTSEDVHTVGGGEAPPCAGLTPNALPETQSTILAESSQTGVSTRNALCRTGIKQRRKEDIPHWYALCCTYGREQAAYDHLVSSILSVVPVLGQAAAIALNAGLGYTIVYVSAIIYLKLITRMMQPDSTLKVSTSDDTKHIIRDIIKESNIKEMVKEGKASYKQAKDSGAIDKAKGKPHCPKCHAEVREGQKFCSECGAKIK